MNRKNFFPAYLEFFQHPYQGQQYIHIAGTKGKTSTSYYIYQMLQESGKVAGLFVSPHVFCEEERIQRDGELISPETLAFYRQKISEAKEQLSHPLGLFEEFLLTAFLFFRDYPVDYVVLEVGIGGLYDSTNVISPRISVISRIKKDHQEILGSRISQIIRQKLGILKPKRPFMIGKQNVFVATYILLATLFRSKDRVPLVPMKIGKISMYEIEIFVKKRAILLRGPLYMFENFVLAYSVLDYLGVVWKASQFTHQIPGRMQAVDGYKCAFLDGAHNEIAAQVLVHTLKRQFSGKTWKIVLCIQKDKDILDVVRQLETIAELFIVCPWDKEIKPEFDPKFVISILEKRKQSYIFVEKEKLNTHLQVDDNILITGSFYHLSIVYNELRNRFI